ncbi:hydrolase [Streptomyces sulfonofaciens]|uniref:lysozyme n=1 Tax=Streptomyces sulfonofaciens TaxID=68272 RepID=A0A919L085_9ACTN|nr:GH25 family lysozyme [Streptomyces sulfonofaciens]GHH77906.1 hydrolase [Streptomyces sulfonofaciens]
MLSHRPPTFGLRRGRRTLAGVLGAAAATLPITAGTATAGAAAAPRPSGDALPLGTGHMGIGYQADTGERSAGPLSGSGGVQGIDVSHYQGAVNWAGVRAAGVQFAWIKATEGTTYKDPRFNANYLNAYRNKVIRGAYHFARPDLSGGAAQARYFAGHGGAWSRDNLTLPGVLDIEGDCYGRSAAALRTWITDFYTTYKARTGRDVVIYTSAGWWNGCTGSWRGMSAKSPLWAAHWTSAAGPTIPAGFPFWTVWQYSSTGRVGGVLGNVDRDKFNGTRSRLLALANNTP